MKKEKGFTLIELLVVIAIIGILAGILFIAINPKEQTDKAKTAKIKTQLNEIGKKAALTFSNNGDYSNLCSGEVLNLSDNCLISNDGYTWAADANLPTGSSWCVDYNGYNNEGNAYGGNFSDAFCNPIPIITQCSDYTNQVDCQNDPENVRHGDECIWNNTTGVCFEGFL